MDLNYWEKQLILYTKGHFKQINYQQDLKYFAAKLYGLGLKQVELYNIANMVTNLYQTLANHGYINFNFKNFLFDSFKISYREQNRKYLD